MKIAKFAIRQIFFLPFTPMPYQLRRIVAINIRNTKGRLPSQRISELRIAGGVLAVGENGVGKTTFLRLLPLFFGAKPSQILRGTGVGSLISYTLPHASSAVAFEYERESCEHLRTVVMFAAKERADSPIFYIVPQGFQEDYFCDENRQFITRDEFAPRLRNRGIAVPKMLELSEYRSVILGERSNKSDRKSDKELRDLASMYSLGPKSLRNLDEIAVAMTQERIDFRDLQNIILQRVENELEAGGSRKTTRELKQRKEDVKSWLDRLRHLQMIQARKPDADRIAERIDKIKGLDAQLCTLHVAVKKALSEISVAQTATQEDRKKLTQEAEAIKAHYEAAILQAQASERGIKVEWTKLKGEVDAALERRDYYDKINVRLLANEQQREGSYRQQRTEKLREYERLTKEAGSAEAAHQTAKREIEKSAHQQNMEIAKRWERFRDASDRTREQVRDARDKSLRELSTPLRLGEIEAQRKELLGKRGEANQRQRNPTPSEAAIEQQREAEAMLDALWQKHDAAKDRASELSVAAEQARRAVDSALETHRNAQSALECSRAALERLSKRATPKEGSLLAFIRSSQDPAWEQTSKLIHEDLIDRTDLEPFTLSVNEQESYGAGAVVLGSTLLQLASVPVPAWYSTQEIDQQMKEAEHRHERFKEDFDKTREAVQQCAKQRTAVEVKWEEAKGIQAVALAELDAAKAAKGRVDRLVQSERAACMEQAQVELGRINAEIEQLAHEEASLLAQLEHERTCISEDAEKRLAELERELSGHKAQLREESKAVNQRKQDALENAENDYARKLNGLGLDSRRVQEVAAERDSLDAKLNSIENNRHVVNAWELFSREVLPHLDGWQRELERRRAELTDARVRLEQLQKEEADAHKQSRAKLEALEDRCRALERDKLRVQDLIDQKLAPFKASGFADGFSGRAAVDLEQMVDGAIRSLSQECLKLSTDFRSLQNLFLDKEGGPKDWLSRKKLEIQKLEGQADHQSLCEEAKLLVEWFLQSVCGVYIEHLHNEMYGFFDNASVFLESLEKFDSEVGKFNSELDTALSTVQDFAKFKELKMRVTSTVGQQAFMKVLKDMRERRESSPRPVWGMSATYACSIPTDEDAALVRAYQDILSAGVSVNMSEQIQLECSLYENGKYRNITNFKGVSSNGNTALIIAMFLMGFAQMIRRDAPVRLVWVADELGRFDAGNVGAFLKTLEANRIDVICASPSADPALARHFPRIAIFRDTGAIFTSENHEKEVANAAS